MSITTLLRFLVGGREAILQTASDRWTLAIGLIFVLSAGFARNYARTDLRREPWCLAIPFVASVASSLGLFAWLYVLAWWPSEFVTHYLSFLGLYWLTAPLAWLYAVPVERWMSRDGSVKSRLAMLGVVAAWRVALIVRILHVLLQPDDGSLFFAVMVYVSGLAVFAIWLTTRQRGQPEAAPEVISFMAVMPPPARTERRLIHRAGCFVVGIALPGFALCGLGLWVTFTGVASWQFPELALADTLMPRFDLWLLAGGSVSVWSFVLPTTQGRVSRAAHVQELCDAGEFPKALKVMTEAGPQAFPPGWEPPPNRFGKSKEGVGLLDAIEATHQSDSTHWLLPHYRRQLEDFVSEARWFWETGELVRLGQVLERLSFGQDLAAIAWKSISELTQYHKRVLQFHVEIETVHELLDEGFLDPAPEMTTERVAALDRLQQLAGIEPDKEGGE